MTEFDLSCVLFGSHGVLRILYLHRHVEILEYSGEHGHGSHPVHLDVQKAVHRHVCLAEESYHDGDVTYGQITLVLHDKDSAHQVKEHGAYIGHGVQHHEEPAACHPFLDVKLDHAAVDVFVPFVLLVFLSEELDQKLTAHRKSLVQDPVHFIVCFLGFTCDSPPSLSCPPCGEDEERYHRDTQKRQYPVLLEHGSQREYKGYRIRKDALEGVGYNGFYSAYIRGHPGYYIALVVRSKEPLRHLLEVPEHLVPHIEGDMLGDPCVYIALSHSYEIGKKRYGERCDYIYDEQSQVLPYQSLVDYLTRKYRRQKPEYRRKRNTNQNQYKLFPVRFQITEDSLHKLLRYLGLRGLLFLCHVMATRAMSSWVRHAYLLLKQS